MSTPDQAYLQAGDVTQSENSVTPQPTGGNATNGAGKQPRHWGVDGGISDYRIELLSKLITAETSKELRDELYRMDTSELEYKVYAALVADGKIDEARALAQASSEPGAILQFIEDIIDTFEAH